MRSKLIASALTFVLLSCVQARAQSGSQLAAIANGRRDAASHKPDHGKVIDFILANMTEEVRREFKKAWLIASAGTSKSEGLVLLYRMPDGSLMAIAQHRTNERRKVTFKWIPSIIAIVHTHPNSDSPHPSDKDLELSDRFRIPVFTITSRGMFVYDPAARKISRVMKKLTWLPSTRSADPHITASR